MSDSNFSLNLNELSIYLEQHVDGFIGPLTMSKFSGGQSNPTFKLNAASGSYVLRRQPPGKLMASAHAVDREYRVLKALQDTDVPLARVYHLCEDREVIGSMFYLMEYCDGNLYFDATLPEIKDPIQRGAIYEELVQTLAALHLVDVDAAGLTDYGKPGNYFARQLDRWTRQYQNSKTQPIPEMDELMEWLKKNQPEDDGKVSLVHGDYRLDNIMIDKTNSKIIAVLDWELSTLGHPYADMAYMCMGLRLPISDSQSASGLLGIDREELGIPSEESMIATYCQLMGIEEIEHWAFYLAFCFFRLAAIAQGIVMRAKTGNASNSDTSRLDGAVHMLARMALDVIEQRK
jgi:aminoglycoside phosphotransferase (APT) family kinase protein